MKRTDWILAYLFAMFMFMAFVWNLDIAVSAMLSGGFMTNGFWISSPMQFYHISLYGMTVVFFTALMFALHHMNIDREERWDTSLTGLTSISRGIRQETARGSRSS